MSKTLTPAEIKAALVAQIRELANSIESGDEIDYCTFSADRPVVEAPSRDGIWREYKPGLVAHYHLTVYYQEQAAKELAK